MQIKRIYEAPASSDGFRVLVDRLWPRGVTKEQAAVDLWLKDVAPSSDLRIWFDHKPERFVEFSEKYREELAGNQVTQTIRQLEREHQTVTLLYAAKDPKINHAQVLLDYLNQHD